MRSLHVAALAAVTASAATAALAGGSGGPPRPESTAPALRTVVGHGTGDVRVRRPARRTSRTIERAVVAARAAATPKAVGAAREDAERVARAAGLTLGTTIGVGRDVPPYGWYEPENGRFGPGRWCGMVGRPGDRRRHCHLPPSVSVRVTLTVEAG